MREKKRREKTFTKINRRGEEFPRETHKLNQISGSTSNLIPHFTSVC